MIIKIKKNLDNRSKNMYTILETAIVSNVFGMRKIVAQYIVLGIFQKTQKPQYMESCPSWSKEHDWKSCKLLKRFRGFESLALRQNYRTPPN